MKWQPPRLMVMLLIGVLIMGSGTAAYFLWPRQSWSEDEILTLRSLWIKSLPPLSPDPSNRYSEDPAAAALGEKIFFDTRFSSNGQVACATCHLPEMNYQDNKRLSEGVGVTNRRSMPIAGTAYSAWFFWDGRKDSQWSQALDPLENPVEHGGNRTQYIHLLAQHYRAEYEAIFGELPPVDHLPAHAGPVEDATALANWQAMSDEDREQVNQIFANLGKAIAAYERRIMPGSSRFDAYVEAVISGDREAMASTLTPDEVAGLRLFIGKANCLQCHNGPLLTDHFFHNTGVPPAVDLAVDLGRSAGVAEVQSDEFNCFGPYSDAGPDDCAELRFMRIDTLASARQFKTPSLRSVAERPPYMHAGQFTTLEEIVDHYNRAPLAMLGHNEAEPLELNERELAQLVAFLRTLSGPAVVSTEALTSSSE